MSQSSPNTDDVKLLSGGEEAPREITPATLPLRQLAELPREELENVAADLGVDPADYRSGQALVTAIHERRQAIAAMDREAMLDVAKWGRRPVPASASREQLALEIAKIKRMSFEGLSERGLVVLAAMRGVEIRPGDDVPRLVKRLKKQEGLFARLNRKKRAWLGGVVSGILGEKEAGDYQFLPGDEAKETPPVEKPADEEGASQASIKEEIEESGLFGGITSRIKRTADAYLNQKLDEVEARIDRKLDEIDRRLAEWRDKEIANRLRILKITLWVSVIVAVVSLIYSYFRIHPWPL